MTERIEARLVYDTKAQPLSSGVRAVVQRARRVLYAADETELVLQIGPDKQADRMKLAGQPQSILAITGREDPDPLGRQMPA